MMHKQEFRLKTLAILITGISYCTTATPVWAENNPAPLSDVEVVATPLSTDEKGDAQVYSKNVSNVYLGKDYLERYRTDSAGDVLKGLNGVYNMNTRTAGSAITPNIRGVAGKGRIPVTIDGTEQTVDVWLNNYGVGDRNYVDPALFRSIAVEKSPAMTRGIKSGVGGSMAIRTIEAEDIIQAGDKWGIEIKTEFANNSTKPQNDLRKYLGWADYRTLPGGATADGAGGGVDPWTNQWSPFALVLDSATPPKNKSGSDHFKFGGDKSLMISAGFKTDMADALAAYSHRSKGNYFAGKRGADEYLHNPIYGLQSCLDQGGNHAECYSSTSFVPNMVKIYKPGMEVFNSNTDTKTLLLKNNWHLHGNQKIALQYMGNDITFGEINPFQMAYTLNMDELNQRFPKASVPQVPGISSKVKSRTYKLGYSWHPEDNKWINFQSSWWHVRTDSERHQSGGMSLAATVPDPLYDAWRWCNVRNRPSPLHESTNLTCGQIRTMYGFTADTTQEEMIKKSWITANPDLKKQLRVHSGALQQTRATRTGFDISNRFQVRDNLAITLGADYQQEKLTENTNIINSSDIFNMYGVVTGLAAMAGPRSAKRREFGVNLNFEWQPTDRLDIQAGVRYQRFRGEDTGLAQVRATRNPRWAFGGGKDRYAVGVMLPYMALMNKEELADYQKYKKLEKKWWADGAPVTADHPYQQFSALWLQKYGLSPGMDSISINDTNGDFVRETPENIDIHNGAVYMVRQQYIPFRNGKLDSSAVKITPEMYNEKVSNPQNKQGDYYKYLIGNLVQDGTGTKRNYTQDKDHGSAINRHGISHAKPGFRPGAYYVTKPITEADKWRQPPELRSHAWAPMLAVTYRLSDNSRIFARYAQMTRFPSLYELTGTTTGGGLVDQLITPEFRLKPERSLNWEVGYGLNFTPYSSKLRHGDVRLTYFSNTIKNVLDTTADKRITQYDKKISTGLELQSRIDTGKYFASFGATYRLKQVTCDRDLAFSYDMYMRRIPSCIEGGFGATRFYQALQPKYSLNLDMGTRLLSEKLELGMRAIYHSKVDTKQYDHLLAKGMGSIFTTTGKPYHWKPSLVLDAYGRYAISKNLAINFGVNNLTNRYYLDPMSNVPVPGPGRTITLGIKGKF